MARADTSFIYTRPTCGLDPKVFQTTLGGGVWYIYTCMKKIRIQSHSFARWLRSYCSHRSKSCLLKMSADVLWKRLIAEQLWVTVFTPELIQRRTLFVFNRGELFFLQRSFGFVPTEAYHLLHRWRAADAACVHAGSSDSVLNLKKTSYLMGLKWNIHLHQRYERQKVFICSEPTIDHQQVEECICKLMSPHDFCVWNLFIGGEMIQNCQQDFVLHVTVWLHKLAENV